jgi:hypothetical protein
MYPVAQPNSSTRALLGTSSTIRLCVDVGAWSNSVYLHVIGPKSVLEGSPD